MQDAVLFGMYNNQGGPRGGSEFKAPNWWMGMLSGQVGSSQITFNTMFSLDPATLDKQGYREIFQVGETFEGEPLIDHQHPHDFFMQLAAVWRIPLGARTGFTLAGAPVREPALGRSRSCIAPRRRTIPWRRCHITPSTRRISVLVS